MSKNTFSVLTFVLLLSIQTPNGLLARSSNTSTISKYNEDVLAKETEGKRPIYYAATSSISSLLLIRYLDIAWDNRNKSGWEGLDSTLPMASIGSSLVLGTSFMSLNASSQEKRREEQTIDLEEARDEFLEYQLKGFPELHAAEMHRRFPNLLVLVKELQARHPTDLSHDSLVKLVRFRLFGD